MNYHNKYIKYKTKYLQLKYNNQYGGGVVPCNKGLNNFIGTCWAVGIQMILFFGHLTSQEFNTVMNQFNISATREERITLRDSFIEEQINRVYKDLKLYDFLPAYIFDTPKRESLQIILTKIIDRYNSKVFESPITIKPAGITNPKENPLRCEKVIAENFKKLFEYPILTDNLMSSDNFGGKTYLDGYLFCNLLSIIFLKHKVSFTNYYNNFSLIDFKDETDLGILINIEGHACCLFICNDKGQYYNDTDKQVYECDWTTLLKTHTPANDLYVISDGCLKFIDDSTIDMYDTALISKVQSLTKISKYEKDSELDNDIQKALTLTHTETIRDPHLLMSLGDMYKFGTDDVDIDLTKAFDFYTRCVNNGAIVPYAHSSLGKMYYIGSVVKKDLKKAFDLFTISVNNRVSAAVAYHLLGIMYEYGINEDGININVNLKKAFKLYKQAFAIAIKKRLTSLYTELCVRLGNMYEKGLGTTVNLKEAFKLYTLAMYNEDTMAYVKLGNMYENGTGVAKNLEEAFKLYTLGKYHGDKMAYVKLGNMYEKGLGTTLDLEQAFNMYNLAMYHGDTTLKSSYGKTIVQSAVKGDPLAYLKLAKMYQEGIGVNKDLTKALEWYNKGQRIFPYIKDFQDKHNELSTIIKDLQDKHNELSTTVLVKSAGENNLNDMHRLASDYISGINNLLGQDLTKAKELLTKGIEILKKNPDPRLSEKFNNDLQRVVDRQTSIDKQLIELHKLADDDNIDALLELAHLYEHGISGKRDLEKAKEIYEKCAKILEIQKVDGDIYKDVLKKIDNIDLMIPKAQNWAKMFA